MPPSTNEHQLRNEIISTRLFMVLFIISLVILLLYNSIITITKAVTVISPSFTDYAQLNSTYSQTLTCPCTKISIDYKKILYVNYTFHQVCTSIFVDEKRINYVFNNIRSDTFDYHDFRVASVYAFQVLSGFCELVNETISNSLNQFYSSQYVSASVTPFDLFQSQTKALIEHFRSSTINTLLSSLLLIRKTTQSNALQTGQLSNIKIQFTPNLLLVSLVPLSYSGCSCIASAVCLEQSSIYGYFNSTRFFLIPGFYDGCYVVEALLRSTLECFYDQACINTIQSYMSMSPTLSITALNSSLPSNYSVNSTINELLGKLMIEEWNPSILHNKYYEECRPAQCTYTYTTRNDVICIITTLIGLVGGLVTVLKLFVALLVKLFAYCTRKRRPTVVPEISNSGT